MACSFCGSEGHNIQTCDSVRRCGHCGRPGHDRRNCPSLDHSPTDSDDETSIINPCSLAQIKALCKRGTDYLAHVYWRARENYFERNLVRLKAGGSWLFTATPKHGVHEPHRRSVNFFVADEKFARRYPSAAEARGFRHGIMVRRSAIEDFGDARGYEFAEVTVGHPHIHGVHTAADYWKFDIGQHRYVALHDLAYATVARLATPDARAARCIEIPRECIVAVW